MAPKTRSQTKQVGTIDSESIHSSEQASASNDKGKKTQKTPKEITKDHCDAFVKNPSINPLTQKVISLGGPKYKELLAECEKHYHKDYEADIIVNLLSEKDFFAYGWCRRIVNDYSSQNTLLNPMYDTDIDIHSPFAQRMLETCKDVHKLVRLHIKFGNGRGEVVPVKVTVENGTMNIMNIDGVHELISMFINAWTVNGREHLPKIRKIILGLQKILDVDYLNLESKVELQDLMFELAAMEEGFLLDSQSRSVSDSSSVKTANRSKSFEAPEGLPLLPKRTRKELIENIKTACIEMRDMISLEDFEDMKKKQLQLVVAIGPKNKNGQQYCYYVKNIFNHVKAAIKEKKLPKEPATNTVITRNDIENVIMPKMRYIKPGVKTPGVIKRSKYPNLELELPIVRSPISHLEYYEVSLKRFIGKRIAWRVRYGYIPAYVDTESTDLNSATVIAKIRELFDNGRLFDEHVNPRVHINKSISYWENGDVERKLNHMMNELNSY